MPLAAVDTEALCSAYNRIHQAILTGERLSSFDEGRFRVMADKLSSEMSLELKAFLCLYDGDENGFFDFFKRALRFSDDPTKVRADCAALLAAYGDFDRASEELRELLNNPVEIIRSGCLLECLQISRVILEDDLYDSFLEIAKKYDVKNEDIGSETLLGLVSQLPDDDPLLLSFIDSVPVNCDSNETMQRLRDLAKKIENDGIVNHV